MSFDRVTLVDYGADIHEPTEPTVLTAERESTETTSIELDAFDSGLASGVSERTLQELADDADSVDDVVAALDVEIPTAREDLATIGRLDDVQTPFEARWGVSKPSLYARASQHGLDADGPRERECEECGNRVMRVRDDEDAPEAGHFKAERPGEEDCSQLMRDGE